MGSLSCAIAAKGTEGRAPLSDRVGSPLRVLCYSSERYGGESTPVGSGSLSCAIAAKGTEGRAPLRTFPVRGVLCYSSERYGGESTPVGSGSLSCAIAAKGTEVAATKGTEGRSDRGSLSCAIAAKVRRGEHPCPIG